MFVFELKYEDYKSKEKEINEILSLYGTAPLILSPGCNFFLELPFGVAYEESVKQAIQLMKHFIFKGNTTTHPPVSEINKWVDDLSEFLYDLKQIRDHLRAHPVKGN